MSSITNEKDNNLSSALKNILPPSDKLDALVGYFYFSGFQEIYKELQDKKIRILVGMEIDKNILSKISSVDIKNLDNYLTPQSTNSKITSKENYYNEFSTVFNKTDLFDNDASLKAFEPANNFAKRALKLIKAKNFKTILDLGCGDGRDSIYFSSKGLKVTALDFSESGINKLKSQVKEIDCIFQDIRNINFGANTFDVIYAHLSLHYFDDETTNKIFTNLYRILKNGGLVFIKCKSTEDVLFGQGEKVAENMWKKGHTRHFLTKEYMAENLNKFKIIKIRKTSSVYHEYKSAFIEAVATK